jgi:hypothetical protein
VLREHGTVMPKHVEVSTFRWYVRRKCVAVFVMFDFDKYMC